jgi:quercetin dioxygenase-like cupin family protein
VVRIQATAADSNGRLGVIEYDVAPRSPGPPLHLHPFDEFFYVLEGALEFRLGDDAMTLEAGGYVYVPGEQPHTFSNSSELLARMLVVAVPGGFEEFFRAVAAATVDGQMPDPETMARLNAEHGVRFV